MPVKLRARADGWTPERQLAFLDALAASGCVAEACASVGVSRTAAYALRARVDAQAFRVAWAAALDQAIARLTDECFSRALHGEAVPHFYKGEQVGEHRRYDNKLAMFLLRYRDPLRYAATLDQMVYSGHPEHAAIGYAHARDRAAAAAFGVEDRPLVPADEVRPAFRPIHRSAAEAEQRACLAAEAAARREAIERAGEDEMARMAAGPETPPPAMASTSSTSARAAPPERPQHPPPSRGGSPRSQPEPRVR